MNRFRNVVLQTRLSEGKFILGAGKEAVKYTEAGV